MTGLTRNIYIRIMLLAAAPLVIGCSLRRVDPSPTSASVEEATVSKAAPLPTPTQTTQTAEIGKELDLREANVLEVEFEHLGDGNYRFDVTLFHDDDGEAPMYADSWQVWDTEGNILGERVLTHGHGTRPFTRSATIEIPVGIVIVLVRGHDMEHGHGGQSMRVNLESGEMIVYLEQGN
jgi:hypothetical protein